MTTSRTLHYSKKASYVILGIALCAVFLGYNIDGFLNLIGFSTIPKVAYEVGPIKPPMINWYTGVIIPLGLYGGKKLIDLLFDILHQRYLGEH